MTPSQVLKDALSIISGCRIFVDCEFNGFGGALISMALVPEDETIEPWYECMEPFLWEEWVLENVRPILGKEPISKGEFRASFLRYIQQFENPIICADWYTDLVHFFSMFAGEDHSQSVGFACRTELKLIENYESKVPHNALSDAIAIREAWNIRPTPSPEESAIRAAEER